MWGWKPASQDKRFCENLAAAKFALVEVEFFFISILLKFKRFGCRKLISRELAQTWRYYPPCFISKSWITNLSPACYGVHCVNLLGFLRCSCLCRRSVSTSFALWYLFFIKHARLKQTTWYHCKRFWFGDLEDETVRPQVPETGLINKHLWVTCNAHELIRLDHGSQGISNELSFLKCSNEPPPPTHRNRMIPKRLRKREAAWFVLKHCLYPCSR